MSREGLRRRDRSGSFETPGEGAPIHDIPERLHELGPHVEVLQVGRANPKAEGGSRATPADDLPDATSLRPHELVIKSKSAVQDSPRSCLVRLGHRRSIGRYTVRTDAAENDVDVE